MENVELARLVVKQVEAEPGLFDMRWYAVETACGTSGCLAGHVLLLSGYRFDGCFFIRPDGSRVGGEVGSEEERDAAEPLGLSGEEIYGVNGDGGERDYPQRLFSEAQTNEEALARFRQLIDASEET